MKNELSAVCVYCASSTKIDPVYFEAATKLGHLLGEHGLQLINGAGSIGLMRAITDGALEKGGKVTGVIPRFMVDNNWHHAHLTEMIVVDTMHERKQKMAAMADAVIALPGGCGTMEELLEVITWKQLGLFVNPIVILNTNGFYDPLLEMFDRAVGQNFMRPQHQGLWQVANTPEEAIGLIYSTPVWDKSLGKFAAI